MKEESSLSRREDLAGAGGLPGDSRVSSSGTDRSKRRADLDRLAQGRRPKLLEELFDFVVHGKKWWLTPIIVGLLLLGLFAALGTTAVGPFLYTLF